MWQRLGGCADLPLVLVAGLSYEPLSDTVVAATMALLSAFFLLLPLSLRPAVPWVLVAAGVALGWSARDMLRDILAAVVLLVERRLRPGIRIRTQERTTHT